MNTTDNFPDSLNNILLEAEFSNSSPERVQQKWEDEVSRLESKRLSRISDVIISTWDFVKVLFSLKPGQTITVDYNGNIFRGRANTEKMHKLPQRFSIGRKNNSVDAGLFDSNMRTSSSVYSPSPAWKNSWDKINARAVSDKSKRQVPMDVSIVFFNMEFYSPDEVIVEKVQTGPLAHQFTEITAKDFPNITLGISKLGSMRYYRKDGEIIWLDAD